MAAEGAMPARIVGWISRDEVDWDALYAEQLPRVFNFFRYLLGTMSDWTLEGEPSAEETGGAAARGFRSVRLAHDPERLRAQAMRELEEA